MFQASPYEIIKTWPNRLLVDVRTSLEYQDYTIPGAVNLPVLNEEERRLIGLTYVREDQLKAKEMGIRYVSHRLPELVEAINSYRKDHRVILFCSRGGYRSSVLFYLLNALHIEVYKLQGGYKAYRHYVNQNLPRLAKVFQFVNLNGYTGVGKTEVLQALAKQGAQVLDLEGLANHRGSSMGHIGLGQQPTQKQFESELLSQLERFSSSIPVFVEGESRRIGDRLVPQAIFDAYQYQGKQVLLTCPMEQRIARIEKMYIQPNNPNFLAEVEAGLSHLAGYLPSDSYSKYIDRLRAGQYQDLIEELINKYYDQVYKVRDHNYQFCLENLDADVTAANLLDKLNLS